MERILIIGDSISIGYTPPVADALAGEAEVVHNPGNGGDSANVLANLPDYLDAAGGAGVVLLNCGLHDIKREFGSDRRQVPLKDYRMNLAEIVSQIKYRTLPLLWATTTPVIHARHHATKGFDRFEKDVEAYNAAAAEIAAAAEVPVCDLNAAVEAAGRESCIGDDGVHMTDEGNRVLAAKVVQCLRSHTGGAA